jgi:hypothetical protein
MIGLGGTVGVSDTALADAVRLVEVLLNPEKAKQAVLDFQAQTADLRAMQEAAEAAHKAAVAERLVAEATLNKARALEAELERKRAALDARERDVSRREAKLAQVREEFAALDRSAA